MDNFKNSAKTNLIAFGTFIYKKETGEILGRTCSGWAQIGVFFFVFYMILAMVFAFHLAIFLAITPGPAAGRSPWNYGKYAYMNYPNRKIDLLLTPNQFTYSMGSGNAGLNNHDYRYMDRLSAGARASGVGSSCLDKESRFGFSIGQPCIYLHLAKVFSWSAELINSTLEDASGLPFNCTFTSPVETLILPLISEPSVLPLNISNNANSRSFPFNNQQNYRPPVIGLTLNLMNLPLDVPSSFEGQVTCMVNFEALNMTEPSTSELNRLYEIPTDATTRIRFQS